MNRKILVLAGLAALAVLAYLPALSLPFISDDFVNIDKALTYVPQSGWQALAQDPVHLYRPLFLGPTYWLFKTFGPWPPAFYASSILLHVGVTWLVFALGFWKPLGWRVSAVAAAFFAVHEGHIEAVAWYSAAYELYLAAFLLLCVICWIRWLGSSGWGWYAGALACYVLALLSKESAVMVFPLLGLVLFFERERWRRGLAGLVPFAALGAAYFGWMFLGGPRLQRLGDGSFSLQAPFLVTWLHSFGRLLWIWGVGGVACLLLLREWRRIWLPALWIGVTLVPYCFLTYMTRIPSRQTYIPSIGLSWIVGLSMVALWDRYPFRRRLVAVLGVVIVLHNIGYMWIWKQAQFRERGEPTEALIAAARRSPGPVHVQRFPFPLAVAQCAVRLAAGKPTEWVVWEAGTEPSGVMRDYSFTTPAPEPADRSPARR